MCLERRVGIDRDRMRRFAEDLIVPKQGKDLYVTFQDWGKGFCESVSYGPYSQLLNEGEDLVGFNKEFTEGCLIATLTTNVIESGWQLKDSIQHPDKIWTRVHITEGPYGQKEEV